MATPKLALIPTGYKAGKLYSVLPQSGVGDFTFARASEATRVDEDGLIETMGIDVPRLDYTDGGCPNFLLEPQRTNLITYSEDFSNAAWNNTNITINSNSIISPDGNLNGTKFIPNTTSGQHYLDRNGVTVNSNATASIFAKKGEYKRFSIRSYFTGANAIFDVNEGIIVSESSVTAKIEDYGNGWYRCSLNETLNTNYGYGIFVMEDDSNNPVDNYSGNGIDGMYFYGASLEIGSFITSYIPTTSSTVTRSAETANGSGNAATFNDSEGVLMAETKGENDGTFNYISISDGGTQNYAGILYTDEDNQITYRYYVGGSGVQLIIDDIIVTNFNKIAIKWKANDFAIWINGIELGTATSGSLNPSGTFNELAFARGGSNNTPFYGNTKQIQYFDSALTDAEIETLTSWQSFLEMANGQNYTII